MRAWVLPVFTRAEAIALTCARPRSKAGGRVWHRLQMDVLLCMREAILASDARIEEAIKWKSPTFVYKGNIASFNPRAKKHASLMFHTGASIPGEFPHLEGTGRRARPWDRLLPICG